MFFKSRFYRPSLALSLTLLVSFAVFADTIRLKDGSIIKGKIVNFGGGKFTVLIGDGTRQRQLDFNAGEVESISFDAVSTNSTAVNAVRNNSANTINQPVSNTQRQQPAPSPVQTAPVTNNQPAISLKPITLNVSVLADNTSNGWTNSGFVVQKGQKIRISSSGRISLGSGRYTTSEGISTLPDANKLMSSQPTGGLIAVVGDDNNDFIFIGARREFTATRDGALFLGVNEGNLEDNSGMFNVKLDIYPND